MKIYTLEKWIRKQIASCDHDIEMSKRLKTEGKPLPFGDDHERWLENVKGRKYAYEETLAHIEADKINKALALAYAQEELE